MGYHKTPKQVVLGRWHRRIGLLVTGLLFVFAISGVALNHQSQWDPYYTVSHKREVAEELDPSMDEDELDLYLRKRYSMDEKLTSSIWERPHIVIMAYTNGISFEIDLNDKSILKVITRKRPVIYNLIHLHLNALKGIWSYFADTFAVALIFLSISGIYLVVGRFTRIEFIFLIVGVLLPVLFYIIIQS
jgi:hypothetical protein